jgi:hypothetical protein
VTGSHKEISFLSDNAVFWCGTPSLTTGWVCNFIVKLLLGLARAATLGCKLRRIRYHILLFPSYNFGHWVTYHYSQGYGGDILTRLHTECNVHEASILPRKYTERQGKRLRSWTLSEPMMPISTCWNQERCRNHSFRAHTDPTLSQFIWRNLTSLTDMVSGLKHFWTCPSTGILENTEKYNVSETRFASVLRWRGPLEYRTMEKVHNTSNPDWSTPL